MSTLSVTVLSPALGVEVRGLELATCGEQEWVRLRDLLLRHKVVAVPDQILDADQHVALAGRFGRVAPSSAVIPGLDHAHPQIKVFDSRRWDGGLDTWHSVMPYMPEPAAISLVYVRIAPAGGTGLRWLSTEAAYDSLDEGLKERVLGLRAVHHAPVLDEYVRAFGPGSWNGRRVTHLPAVEHPVVRRHPETGRLGLFINPWSTRSLVGLSPKVGDRLLATLFDHLARPEHQLHYLAEPGTLLVSDVRSTLHRVTDHGDAPRILHRVTVYDGRPSGPVDDLR